jgi:DNA-binding FadR family transcriptional regulator
MAPPMYQQIADDLRSKIELGILKPGQKLPTEIQLRDAIKRLTSLGLLESPPGSGTFVTQKIDDEDDNAFRVTVTVFPADRNQFIVNIGKPRNPQYKAKTDDTWEAPRNSM